VVRTVVVKVNKLGLFFIKNDFALFPVFFWHFFLHF